jgi:hypothetical protein
MCKYVLRLCYESPHDLGHFDMAVFLSRRRKDEIGARFYSMFNRPFANVVYN